MSCTSEWAPQPWSNDTTRPSSLALPLAHTPNISDSGPASRTRKPQVRARWRVPPARAARPARCRRRTTAAAAWSRPSSDRTRTRPSPSSRPPARTCARSSASSGVVAEGVRRHEPRVVLLDGQQVARGQVAGLDPLLVRHPLGRDDRLVAGQQHDLVDGDLLLPRRPGDGDRPAPAAVAGAGAGEEVGDHPLALGQGAEVLADVARPPRSSRAARATSTAASDDGVGLGSGGSSHGHRRDSSPSPPACLAGCRMSPRSGRRPRQASRAG